MIVVNQLDQKVVDIAYAVRDWAEDSSRKNLKVDETHEVSLRGWCAVASGELWRRLKRAGIDSVIHMWVEDVSAHVFVVVDDMVVDVTASQFFELRKQAVFIEHYRLAQRYYFYHTHEVFGTADELRKAQLKEQWPREQVAYKRICML